MWYGDGQSQLCSVGRNLAEQIISFMSQIYLYDDEVRNTLSKLAKRVITHTFQIVSFTRFYPIEGKNPFHGRDLETLLALCKCSFSLPTDHLSLQLF